MKRFYKQAETTPEGGVTLDGRAVRTPARALLHLPSATLAHAVADEWNAQGEAIDPQSMPLTGLANAAIDRVAPDPVGFASSLSAYGESELLCYRAADPPELVERQAEQWNPWLDWARARYDVSFTLVTGIMHQPQPEPSLARLAAAVQARSPWELAALNPIVTISGSLVLALAILESALGPEAGFSTAHLDELWQAEQWGEDDLALQARAVRERDFQAAARFLTLLSS